MNYPSDCLLDILNSTIPGYHSYVLEKPFHLSFASQSLCSMTGCTQKKLTGAKKDHYAEMIHPADRKRYEDFISCAAREEGTRTAEYRLVSKDSRTFYVRDTFTSRREPDGSMTGHSVLTDISELTKQLDDLRFLNETIPCGYLKYTCEKQPRVTYINQNMLNMLHFTGSASGEVDYLDLYKSNIFLMIPMEERRRFSRYLDRVYEADRPLAGEMTLQCCDGARVRIFGWVTHSVSDRGEEEFQCVCMDITERHAASKAAAEDRYLKALTDVYDKIFEFDIDADTVRCLHCEATSMFNKYLDLSMQISTACEKWIVNSVVSEERDMVRDFFDRFVKRQLGEAYGNPPQISYHAMSSDGTVRLYNGIFVKAAGSASYYCCRDVEDPGETAVLRTENDQLKANMQHLVSRFADGVATFEVTEDERIRPLYASDNVCDFFGYSREEWLDMMNDPVPVRRLITYSDATYEDFLRLLREGESDFTYYDSRTGTHRKIRANCSSKDADGHPVRFIMLFSDASSEDPAGSAPGVTPSSEAVSEGAGETAAPGKRTVPRSVRIRTFGYFDVFVGDQPIAFRNKKSEELFALLIDRRGGFITSEEAISYLWADEPANTLTLARYRKAALRLKNTLEEYGIADIIETVDGKRRIIPEKVSCDLYDYLSGDEQYSHLFRGSYLTNYSWGETTLGELQTLEEL